MLCGRVQRPAKTDNAFAHVNAVRVRTRGPIPAMESISLHGFTSKGHDGEGMMLPFSERGDVRGGERLTPTVGD